MTVRLERPVRRLLKIAGVEYIVELAPGGIMFRQQGTRQRAVAPMTAVLLLANDYRRRDEHSKELQRRTLARIGR